MRPENDIFSAAIPTPYTILGLRLKPFSLGHYMHLRRHGCAFVSDSSKTATREDLIFAVLVCSLSFEEFTKFLNQDETPWVKRATEVFRWLCFRSSNAEVLAALSGNPVLFELTKWGRKIGLFDVRKKSQEFVEYMETHTREPKVWIEKNQTESGSHWAENVFTTLTGSLGFTSLEALNMSIHQALIHFYSYAESMGIVRLMTDDEIELIEST